MKPKPLSSLNHFTVPVAICSLPGGYVRRNAGGAKATTTYAGTELPGRPPGTIGPKSNWRPAGVAPAATRAPWGGRATAPRRSGTVACLMATRVEADDRDNPTSGGGTNAVGGIGRKDAIREVPEPGPLRVTGDDLRAERSAALSDERIRP